MEQLLIWSLKSSAILAIVFACYYFLFRNNTVFKLRRTLLLLILGLSCLAPLFEIQVSQEEQPVIIQQAAQLKSSTIDQIKLAPIQEASVQPHSIPEGQGQTVDWGLMILYAYLAGISVSLALLLFELGKVAYLKFTGSRAPEMGRNVIAHRSITSPFSFYRSIFIPENHDYSDTTWKTISIHEQAHIDKRHSLDLLLARLLQSLFWFNPIIYLLNKELRAVHEAQADEEVLKNIGFSAYAQTLMQVSLPGYQLPVAHSFAVISSFSKRLKLMKTHRTKLKTTLLSIVAISLFSFGIIGWSSLKGQDKKKEKGYEMITKETATILSEEGIKNFRAASFANGYIPKLTSEHSKVMEVLIEENPNSDIRYRYFKSNSFHPYLESYLPDQKPLYITEITDDQKTELYRLVKDEEVALGGNKQPNGTYKINYYPYKEFVKNLDQVIDQNYNYLMIYESTNSRLPYKDELVLEPNEVDLLPSVVGGLDNLAKTIAFDITIPEELDKNKLPETVDFEFVVQGGNTISHLNLLTELKGSDKKNEHYYKFFGTIHNSLRKKISTIYPWKRGIKDGKEVLVRMKISIPTKYMF